MSKKKEVKKKTNKTNKKVEKKPVKKTTGKNNVKEKAKGMSRSAVKTSIKDNKKVVYVDPKGKDVDDEIMSASDLIAKAREEENKVQENTKKIKSSQVVEHIGHDKNITKEEIGEVLNKKCFAYAMSINENRAFPFLEDGLKPSQRFFLWGMKKAGADKNTTLKSSSIVGQVMLFNPHGDAGIYKAGVRMVDSTYNLLIPFIIGQGQFGKHFSEEDIEAQPRYTEMMMSPICKELVEECCKYHPSNMEDNHDGKYKQPKLISAPFPNILANSQFGIGEGFQGNFGSFNLIELCNACISVIENIKKSDKELLKEVTKKMPTMDFPTGAITCINNEDIKNIYLTGEGKITCRAVFEDDKKERTLTVKEIPFSTTIEKIVKAVYNAVDSKKITEINDIKNLTDKKGLKIAIDYKTGTNVDELIKKLLILTPLQSDLNVNMYLVYKGIPQCLGVIECIKKWVEHRREWLNEEFNERLKEVEAELHLLEGLQKILLDIDKAIKIVRNSKTDAEVIEGLKKTFKLDDIQAEFVANIKLRNLNKDYILNQTKKIKELKDLIKELQDKLKHIDREIINDLERVKKQYGIERKTKIVDKWEEIDKQQKIEKVKEKVDIEGNSIVFTGIDSVKRVSEGSSATMQGYVKNTVANSGEILAFTNKCKVFKWGVSQLKANNITKIADIKKIAKKLEAGEHIIYTTPLIEDNKMVVVFENSKAVKFSMSEYKTEKNYLCFKKGINAKNGTPIYLESISEDKDITINGKVINTAIIKEVDKKEGSGNKIKI